MNLIKRKKQQINSSEHFKFKLILQIHNLLNSKLKINKEN